MKEKKNLRKGMLWIIISFVMVLGLMPGMSMTVWADGPTELTADTLSWKGEYTVTADVTMSGKVSVEADTILNITSGKTVTLDGHQIINNGYTLTVTGGGTLSVTGGQDEKPALSGKTGSNLIVDNATVIATGFSDANGNSGSGIYQYGNITLKTGTLTVIGGTGYNRGRGIDSCSSLTVNGGTLSVTGGNSNYQNYSGGLAIDSKSMIINGGTVIAKGGDGNAIGGSGIRADLTINGGTITANGGNGNTNTGGDGITGEKTTTINGGTVILSGGASSTEEKYGKGVNTSTNLILGSGVSMLSSTDNVNWIPYDGSTRTRYMKTGSYVKTAAEVTTAPTAKANLVENGNAQELVTEGIALGGTMKYAVTTVNQEPSADVYTFDNTSLPTATNAGTYYVWYKAVGDSNHSDSPADKVQVSIENPEVEVEAFDIKGYPYTGKAVEPEVKATDKKTQKALVKDKDFTVKYVNNVNAGDPSGVVITFIGDYAGVAELKKNFQITPKPITVTAEDKTKVQGEADPELTFVADGLAESDSLSGKLARDAGEDPGEYKINRGTLRNSNYNITFKQGVFTIKKSEGSSAAVITAPAGRTLTYNGQAQELVTAGTAEGGTMQYAIGTDATNIPASGWSTSIPVGIDAGTYHVWYKAVGEDDHSDSEAGYVKAGIKSTTTGITFDVNELTLKTGEEKSIIAAVVPEGTPVTWKSDNEAVATVDIGGKVKTVSEGTATIKGTITIDGMEYSAECKITVTGSTPQPTPTESSIKLNITQMLLLQGRERALTATTVPEGLPVTWKSSDSTVAFVTPGGVVTGLKIGMATVTATIAVDGTEYSASCLVNVVPETYRDSGEEHVHKYVWNTIEATEDVDGELRYQCETCGDIKERVPLTAYNVFNMNTTEKIRKAPKDSTVRIETNKWISFHKMVMEALAERKDVTLEISFLDEGYKGNRCTVVIPKGTDTMSLVDKNGFTGFLFLGGKFGMKTN